MIQPLKLLYENRACAYLPRFFPQTRDYSYEQLKAHKQVSK